MCGMLEGLIYVINVQGFRSSSPRPSHRLFRPWRLYTQHVRSELVVAFAGEGADGLS